MTSTPIFLSQMLVAAKFHDDAFASNAWYSKVGGVVMEEINRLEMAVLTMTQWRLFVEKDEYDAAMGQLEDAWLEVQEKDREAAVAATSINAAA